MMKKIFSFVILMFISIGCNILDNPIRVGVDSQENSQFMKIAKELGYLDDSFEVVEYKNRGDNVESFYMGRTDVVYSSVFDSIFFYDKGEAGQIFLLTSTSKKTRALFVRDKTSNLRGKTIAMEADTDEYMELLEYLETLNLKRKDVNIVFREQKEATEEFYKGEVDALYFYKPFDEDLFEKGRIIEASESIEELDEVFVANKKTIRRNKRKLKIIIDAWYKVLYIKLNEPERYLELLKDIDFNASDKYRQNYFFREDNQKMLSGKKIEEVLNKKIKNMNLKIEVGELYTGEVVK